MHELLLFIIVVTAQAYLTEVIMHSVLLEPVRKKLISWHQKFGELFNCRMCLGFWVALALTGSLLYAFSVAALGHVFGEKFLDCKKCKAPSTVDSFKVVS